MRPGVSCSSQLQLEIRIPCQGARYSKRALCKPAAVLKRVTAAFLQLEHEAAAQRRAMTFGNNREQKTSR